MTIKLIKTNISMIFPIAFLLGLAPQGLSNPEYRQNLQTELGFAKQKSFTLKEFEELPIDIPGSQVRFWWDSVNKELYASYQKKNKSKVTKKAKEIWPNLTKIEILERKLLIDFSSERERSLFVKEALGLNPKDLANRQKIEYYGYTNEAPVNGILFPLAAISKAGGWIPGDYTSGVDLPENWTYVARKKNGNMKGAFFKNSLDNSLWLIKEVSRIGTNNAHQYDLAIEEVGISKIFQRLGIPTPHIKSVRGKNSRLYAASQYDQSLVEYKDISNKEINMNAYLKMFFFSSFMGNWDFFTDGNVMFKLNPTSGLYDPILVDVGETLTQESSLSKAFTKDKHKEYTVSDIHAFLKPQTSASQSFFPFQTRKDYMNSILPKWTNLIKDLTDEKIYTLMDEFLKCIDNENNFNPDNLFFVEEIPDSTKGSPQRVVKSGYFADLNDTEDAQLICENNAQGQPELSIVFSSPENRHAFWTAYKQHLPPCPPKMQEGVFLSKHSLLLEDSRSNHKLIIKSQKSKGGRGFSQEDHNLRIHFMSATERHIFMNLLGLYDFKGNGILFNPKLDSDRDIVLNLKGWSSSNTPNRKFLDIMMPKFKAIKTKRDLMEYDEVIEKNFLRKISYHNRVLLNSFLQESKIVSLNTTPNIQSFEVRVNRFSYPALMNLLQSVYPSATTHLSIGDMPITNEKDFQKAYPLMDKLNFSGSLRESNQDNNILTAA